VSTRPPSRGGRASASSTTTTATTGCRLGTQGEPLLPEAKAASLASVPCQSLVDLVAALRPLETKEFLLASEDGPRKESAALVKEGVLIALVPIHLRKRLPFLFPSPYLRSGRRPPYLSRRFFVIAALSLTARRSPSIGAKIHLPSLPREE